MQVCVTVCVCAYMWVYGSICVGACGFRYSKSAIHACQQTPKFQQKSVNHNRKTQQQKAASACCAACNVAHTVHSPPSPRGSFASGFAVLFAVRKERSLSTFAAHPDLPWRLAYLHFGVHWPRTAEHRITTSELLPLRAAFLFSPSSFEMPARDAATNHHFVFTLMTGRPALSSSTSLCYSPTLSFSVSMEPGKRALSATKTCS